MAKRILFVEDESEFLQSFTIQLRTLQNDLTSIDVTDFAPTEGGGAVEDQFHEYVIGRESAGTFDGALVDFDLSMMHNGISQSLVLSVLRRLGIPVCRYSKKGVAAQSDRLRLFRRLMTDGPLAVPFSLEINLADELPRAAEWILSLFASFSALRNAISERAGETDGPSSLLARALSEPDAEVDFAGYREAYPYYFADLLHSDEQTPDPRKSRRLATQVGYWFVNCILAFPGPILNRGATAAVLGFDKVEALADQRLKALLDECEFKGPFSSSGTYFWRQRLLARLDKPTVESAVKAVYQSEGIGDDLRSLRYCLLNNRPMQPTEQPSRPDWIPAGATESYVERGLYKKLNPWISIK